MDTKEDSTKQKAPKTITITRNPGGSVTFSGEAAAVVDRLLVDFNKKIGRALRAAQARRRTRIHVGEIRTDVKPKP